MKKKFTFKEFKFLSLLVMLLLLGSSFSSNAADVTINAPTLSTAVPGYSAGVITINGNLTITGTGSITNNDPSLFPNNGAGPITIVVTGNMVIAAGGSIYAENQIASGNGGDITITVGGTFSNEGLITSSNLSGTSGGINGGKINIHVTGNSTLENGSLIKSEAYKGDGGAISMTIGLLPVVSSFTMNTGATISSSNTSGNGSGGAITVHVTGDIFMDLGSTIEANSYTGPGGTIEFTGASSDPAISINSIYINGQVLSQTGGLTGAGCNPAHGGFISIISLQDLWLDDAAVVSSKGSDPGADLVHLGGCNIVIYGLVESTGSGHAIPTCPVTHLVPPYRPDKPANSTAGVEVWAATLIIDNTSPHNGEINADLCCGGGSNGTSWIDLFAKEDITITGTTSNFVVHANGKSGNTDVTPDFITVKSVDGNIFASGNAIQAEATSAGSDGGTIIIEATKDVNLNDAVLYARGGGGSGLGGTIGIRSWGTSSPVTGDIVSNAGTAMDVSGGTAGVVTLTECGTTAFNGTVTPGPNPTPVTGVCDGIPLLALYVGFFDCSNTFVTCEPCTGPTIDVTTNVTIDFNTNPPTYMGDPALAPFFDYDNTGITPGTWFAKFNLGGNSLHIWPNVTITVTKVGGGNNLYAPGLQLLACNMQMDNTCHIIVESTNKNAGDITILTHMDILVNGEIRDEVTGTNGMPGAILLQSKCGVITVSPTGRIFDLGVDGGGNLISLLTCGDGGDITVDNGLVKAFGHAHADNLDITRPRIKVVSLNGAVTINANTAEPIYDEIAINGGKYDLWGGLLSWVRDNNKPGMVWVQAAGDITVRGHGTDPTGPVETSFGAIAARATASNSPGGLVDIRSMGGSIFGFNRAFDVCGRNRLTVNYANIKLFAYTDIVLTKTPLTNATFNPIVDASGPGSGDKGGRNDLTAYHGKITIGTGAKVSTSVPAGGGSGTNLFTYCTSYSNSGTVTTAPSLAVNCLTDPVALWDFVCEDPLSPISPEKSDIINNPVPSNGLLIYPNPAKESFTLQINNAINQGSILTLQDLAGKEILHTGLQLQEGVNSYPVSIAGISEGVYIVKLQTGTEVRQAKLIINR